MEKRDGETITAYHEASHIAACLAFKTPVDEVTIEPGQRYIGRSSALKHEIKFVGFTPQEARDEHAIRRAIIAMSGHVGEEILAGKFLPLEHASGTDVNELLSYTEGWKKEDKLKWIRFIHEQTRTVIKSCWPIVVCVAEELLEKRTLSGSEIDQLILKKVIPKNN